MNLHAVIFNMARMLPRAVKLVPEGTCLPVGEVYIALSGLTDWILHNINKRDLYFFTRVMLLLSIHFLFL